MARPKKTYHYKLQPFRNTAGSESWRVTGTKPDGARIRQNFSSKPEALQKLAELEGERIGHVEAPQVQRTRLSAQELADAESAILSAAGRKISKIVTHYIGLEARAKAKGLDLDKALAFAEAHFRAETTQISVLGAYEEFTASRTSGAQATKNFYEATLRLLLKPDPNKQIHTFNVADIENILSGYKNINSRRTFRRSFSVFFNWAVRHHYCLENPCDRLDRLPKDLSQIAIFSREEIRRLLLASIRYRGGVGVAPIAIGLFAGLRPSEIADLKPEDIGEKVIRVTGGKLRRKLKRTTPVPPVLATWLKAYPFTGLPAGWDYKMKQLKKITRAARWVQDIIRHTSISFQTERDKNEALTAYNCGTSVQMMNLHYRNTIGDESAVAEFWHLTPDKILAEKNDVELPDKRQTVWPEKAALTKLVWEKSLVRAAADIGVSDVALKKRCVKLGISLPTPGHWARQRRDRAH